MCVFLDDRDAERPGQIAHLNRNPRDHRLENLVWLCLEDHDAFDSTSQSKGLTIAEVKECRRRLYERLGVEWINDEEQQAGAASGGVREIEGVGRGPGVDELGFLSTPWRYPLWQVANQPDFFAFKAANGADGVCLIERIELPDARIVIVCIAVAGNPGNSITNCVEELAFQMCSRFGIPGDRLVWIEHYDYPSEIEWELVTLKERPADRPFADPEWWRMADDDWADLRMRPKARLVRSSRGYESKVKELFDWPTDALFEPG